MEIKEIRNLLPELETEENFGTSRLFYIDKFNGKTYISNPLINKERNLVAWVETQHGYDDKVDIKIYRLGNINRLITRWSISPIEGNCSVYFMKFYPEELILLWRDDNHHLVRMEFPQESLEASIKMIKLRPLISFDGKGVISYQYYDGQSSDRSVQRITIPDLEKLKELTEEEAIIRGIQLSENWIYNE